MAVYHYLVKNDEGARSEGDIRAESIDLAVQKLTSNGQIVINLKEVDTTFDFLGPFLDEINLTFERIKNRVPLANLVFFTRQLATMFSAGPALIVKHCRYQQTSSKHLVTEPLVIRE